MSSIKLPCLSKHRHAPALLRGAQGKFTQLKQQSSCRHVLACAEARKSSAEVAKTITNLVTYGTLCTSTEEGLPLGTFITFILDDDGCPMLRLRKDAVHTNNLKARSKCTLFAHVADGPARYLARVTLLGSVEDIEDEEEARQVAVRHGDIYRDAVGVDAPHPDDTFMRLKVDECFFVGGLSVCSPPSCYYTPRVTTSRADGPCRGALGQRAPCLTLNAFATIELCAMHKANQLSHPCNFSTVLVLHTFEVVGYRGLML